MAYVKNVFDKTAITGAFLNSDDTGLITNIFLTEPRRYGLRVIKDFDGLPFGLGDTDNPRQDFGRAYGITIEGGVQILHRQAHVTPYRSAATAAFAGVDIFTPLQQRRHFNWRDGSDISLGVRFDGSWRAAARLRYGKASGKMQRDRGQVFEVIYLQDNDPDGNPFGILTPATTSFNDGFYTPTEKRTLVDFSRSHEIMAGDRMLSTLGLGVRGANLTSTNELTVDGIPNIDLPRGFILRRFPAFDRYAVSVSAYRIFRGPARWSIGTDPIGCSATKPSVSLAWTGALIGRRRILSESAKSIGTYGPGGPFTGIALLLDGCQM